MEGRGFPSVCSCCWVYPEREKANTGSKTEVTKKMKGEMWQFCTTLSKNYINGINEIDSKPH